MWQPLPSSTSASLPPHAWDAASTEALTRAVHANSSPDGDVDWHAVSLAVGSHRSPRDCMMQFLHVRRGYRDMLLCGDGGCTVFDNCDNSVRQRQSFSCILTNCLRTSATPNVGATVMCSCVVMVHVLWKFSPLNACLCMEAFVESIPSRVFADYHARLILAKTTECLSELAQRWQA